MGCETQIVVTFEKAPKQCCINGLLGWSIISEAQKLRCGQCLNLLSTVRVEKDSFIAEDWKRLCAIILRKTVFQTRDDVDRWLENNWINRRFNRETNETEKIDIVRETPDGFVVIHTPYTWFARGTLKTRWISVGIIMIEGNLLDEFDRRIPTDEELSEMAEFVERI